MRAYRQLQPFAAGPYSTSGGTAEGFDSLIVAVETDEGVTGWGEMAPLGAFYAEAFAGGRAGRRRRARAAPDRRRPAPAAPARAS